MQNVIKRNQARHMQQQAGFTLIELVVVITILAALSAIVLPRYVALQSDARRAKAQALYGGMRAASVLAKARCELDLAAGLVAAGTCGNAAPQVTMEGLAIDIVNRYPAATAPGIDAAAQIVVADGFTITAGATRLYDIAGGTAPNCRVTYTAAAVNAAPAITLNTVGC